VNAGNDTSICSGQNFIVPGGRASASNHNGIFWTENGAGTITSGATTLTPTYTPGVGETGTITLTLTATAFGSCTNISDDFILTINPQPIISNPGTITRCSGYQLPAIVGTNLSGNVAYFTETNRTGDRYDPGDIIPISDRLYINDVNGSCSDEVFFDIIIDTPPSVEAGTNDNICVGETYTIPIGHSSASNFNTILWSENGTGTITAGANTLTPTYSPGAGEVGNVTLTLTATGNGICPDISDILILTIYAVPDITSPGNQNECSSYTLPPFSGVNITSNIGYFTGT
ncbi:MAG: hypothetical protein CVU05_08790, partial [Bacteroidetes bacterium HGW-Bacteroidetes-21]